MKSIAIFASVAVAGLAMIGFLTAAEVADTAAPSSSATACCAKCGCHAGLIPICHSYCTSKKETKYRYYCQCDTKCFPDHCPCTLGCGESRCETGGCERCCENGNCECEKCTCLIKDTYKLVKVPYTVDVPVHKCTIEWVCPKCRSKCGFAECSDTSTVAPASLNPRQAGSVTSVWSNPTNSR